MGNWDPGTLLSCMAPEDGNGAGAVHLSPRLAPPDCAVTMP